MKKMVLTFKTRIYPTKEQRDYIKRACGLRRWTWNWAVSTYFENVKNGKFLTVNELQKILNNEVVTLPENQWMQGLNSMIRGEALKDFGIAVSAYNKAQRKAKHAGQKCNINKYKPSYKKKGKCVDSFRYFTKNAESPPFKVKSVHHFTLTYIKRP